MKTTRSKTMLSGCQFDMWPNQIRLTFEIKLPPELSASVEIRIQTRIRQMLQMTNRNDKTAKRSHSLILLERRRERRFLPGHFKVWPRQADHIAPVYRIADCY